MPLPTLSLSPKWTATQKHKVAIANIKLGDGYNLLMSIGTNSHDEIWEIDSPAMNANQMQSYKTLFEQLAGVDQFEWSPAGTPPLHAYVCSAWRITPVGPGYYRLSATFESFKG